MTSQTEMNLSLDIVQESFGPIAAKVAHDLMLHGRQSLQQLSKGKPKQIRLQIRNSLSILVHHRMVTFSAWSDRGNITNFYQFEVLNCLLRLRFPFYIQLCKRAIPQDPNCSRIIHAVLLDSKLTPKEILDTTKLSEVECFDAMQLLISSKLLITTTEDDLQTKRDLYMKMEDDERNNVGMPLTASETKKLKLKMSAEQNRITALGPASNRNTIDYNSAKEMFQVLILIV